jgi:predicted RNase H-like HicB family nuclease
MALTFPVFIGRVNGQFQAESPALPGWTGSAPDVDEVLGQAKMALEGALTRNLEASAVLATSRDGYQVHNVTVDEPSSWWDKDPTE